MKCLIILLVFGLLNQVHSSRKRRNSEGFNVISGSAYVPVGPPRVHIDCSSASVFVNVSKMFINSFNYTSVEGIMFLNENGISLGTNCTLTNQNNGYTINLNNAFGQCAHSIQVMNEHVYVNYTACVVPKATSDNPLYSREIPSSIIFSCVYPWKALLSSGQIIPHFRKSKLTNQLFHGNLKFNIWRYNDSSCTTKVPANETVIYVTKPLYYKVTIENGNASGFIAQLEECWVTPTANPVNETKFYIIKNGCPAADPMMNFQNTAPINYETFYGTFGFFAFLWNNIPDDQQQAYVHCSVKACGSHHSSICTNKPACTGKRRRRSVHMTGQSQLVTGIPISIVPLPCDKDQFGCSHECIMTGRNKNTCLCPDGMYLGKDLKTCQGKIDQQEKAKLWRTTNIKSYRFFHLDIMIFVTAGLLLVCMVCLYIKVIKLKQQNNAFVKIDSSDVY